MRTAGFGIVSVLAAAVCARLGFWQLDRLEQRRAQNVIIESRLTGPPIPMAPDWPVSDTVAFRRATVMGVYDTDRTIVEVFRSRNGVPGVYVVSPLMLNDTLAVLVERGWAPAPDARTVDVGPFAVTGPVVVQGYIHPVARGDSIRPADPPWPRFVRFANPEVFKGLFPYELLPVVVRRTGGAGSEQLTVLSVPALEEGAHLGYAVQWFSFGAIALIGGFIWIRQRRRELAA